MSKIQAVAGSNVFGQWFNGDATIKEFQCPRFKNPLLHSDAKLYCSAWAYNIILQDNHFYIIGAWLGQENKFLQVTLPSEIANDVNNVFITGNDEKLFVINKITLQMWLYNFKLAAPSDEARFDWSVLPPLDTVSGTEAPNEKQRRINKTVVKVAICNHLVYVLLSDGSLYEMPSLVDTSHVVGKIIDIDGGYEHVIILTDIGRVYTWGNGRRCQLGHGSLTNLEIPTEVEALGGINITKVKAGGWHCLALANTGDLYAWGWNESGQLGIQKFEHHRLVGKLNQPTPYLVDLYEGNKTLEVNIIDIACGSRHSVILLENNTLWSTGLNTYGQLGLGFNEVDRFKRAYECSGRVGLVCGPWSSVVVMQD